MVEVHNTGDVPFLTDIEKYTSLVDRGGRTYARNVELTDLFQTFPASVLAPDWSNSRSVIFQIKGNVDIDRFRMSLHPGSAKQTQDWRLT